jgi:hypothetical protein
MDKRSVFCVHCLYSIQVESDDKNQIIEAYKQIMAHEQVCQKGPIPSLKKQLNLFKLLLFFACIVIFFMIVFFVQL